MGIQGLLMFLKSVTREAHISEFENEFVAIDAYCWLHKGIYACCEELVMNKPTKLYVNYCMRYIEMLLHYKVKPILVFDGKKLSSKLETEKKRQEERKIKKQRAVELLKAGNDKEGRKLLCESIDVSHEMALKLMKECRKKDIDCIVAPYEADAQLAYLSLNNIVKCIITEDSDLLVYGCEKVMFKMQVTGSGQLITKNEVHRDLLAWDSVDEEKFRYMCILSGCDYLPSLHSIGPVSALKFVNMLDGRDIYEMLPRLPIQLNKIRIKVTEEYIQGFKIANNTFKHQLVYDPFQRREVPLLPPINDDDIVGEKLSNDLAFQLALGNIEPITMTKIDDFDPDKTGEGFTVLWKEDFLPNATSRRTTFSFGQWAKEGKKRERKTFESAPVRSSSFSFKRQCTPQNVNRINSTATKQTKIPETAFIFEPSVSNTKKGDSKIVDESKLLISRYFSLTESKVRRKRDSISGSDSRRNETGELVERLCDELSSERDKSVEGDNNKENSEQQSVNRNSLMVENSCSHCGKHVKVCKCNVSIDEISETQHLNDCLKKFEEHKKKNETAQIFLLDKINEKENEVITTDSSPKEKKEEEYITEVSLQKFPCLNDVICLSSDGSSVDAAEKENAVCDEIVETAISPSSPVFKVQNNRFSSSNTKCEKSLDTTNSSTSFYFPSTSSSNSTIPSLEVTKSKKKLFSRKSDKKINKSKENQRTLFDCGVSQVSKEDE